MHRNLQTLDTCQFAGHNRHIVMRCVTLNDQRCDVSSHHIPQIMLCNMRVIKRSDSVTDSENVRVYVCVCVRTCVGVCVPYLLMLRTWLTLTDEKEDEI